MRLRGRLRRCELHAAAVVSGVAPRRRELLWRRLPLRRPVGGGAVRCACDGDAIDFAVLQENKTARIPRRGCADPTADNYDGSVDIAYAAACTYTPPPPPPPPDYFIPFALTAFTGGWVLLSLAMAGFTTWLRGRRRRLGQSETLVRLPEKPPSRRFLRSWLRALSNDHAYLRLLSPADGGRARGTPFALSAPQCVAVVAAPLQLSLLANAALLLWWEDWTSEVGNPSDWRRYVGLCAASLLGLAPLQPLLSALFRRANDAYLRTHSSLLSIILPADGYLQSAYKGEGFFYDVRRARADAAAARRRRRRSYVPDDDEIELGEVEAHRWVAVTSRRMCQRRTRWRCCTTLSS